MKYLIDTVGNKRTTVPLSQKNFLPPFPNKKSVRTYLVLGFDTEYQTSAKSIYTDGPKAGEDASSTCIKADHELLSYQFCCETIHVDDSEESISWTGIVLPFGPDVDQRLSLGQFVEIALGEGVRTYPQIQIPRDIYLVSHFTRADLPGFIDFKSDHRLRQSLNLQNLRGTFVTDLRKDLEYQLENAEDVSDPVVVKLMLRDSMHLAPQNAKSLHALGNMLAFEKIELAQNPEHSISIKKNMKALMTRDWDTFERYAKRDAEICARYTAEIIKQYYKLTGNFRLPATLSSIGVALLKEAWRRQGRDALLMVGKESIKERYFSKKLGRYATATKHVDLKKVHWHTDFVTECYHGGRNEQFWFGPAPEGIWYDYDLQSAYPSVMSLIGIPEWNGIRFVSTLEQLLQCKPVDLAYANVNFRFPPGTRYPCLPVRTDSGLIFPLSGNASTHVSEILLAQKLGCELDLVEGRYVPTVRHPKGNRAFQDFLVGCIEQRNRYAKKTVMNLFWKEVANSTYGKTAQGLRRRRVFNLKDEEMEDLPECDITNPFYASFITAYCRGVLSEIMNNLPERRTVFSVTTDGFLTDADEAEIIGATRGTLSRYMKDARHKLVGNELVYEVKHVVRQPVGWRTRGQATIKQGLKKDYPGNKPKEEELVVLAKGGIQLESKHSKIEQNQQITRLFFNRRPKVLVPRVHGLGIKDMYLEGRDLVSKEMTVRLSMEYDWKRKPVEVGESDVRVGTERYRHLWFNTAPWETVDQYQRTRDIWAQYRKDDGWCLKTEADYRAFADYLTTQQSLDAPARRFLRKKDGDVARLRRDIIVARRYRKAGTHRLKGKAFGYEKIFPDYKLPAAMFAEILNDKAGVPCKKSDVDNGVKAKVFTPHQVPDTPKTRQILSLLRNELFPALELEQFLAQEASWDIKPQKFDGTSLG